MTVHKSQGSQFDAVAFLLPSPDSRVLTRELLYTAVTRARERLILVGPERPVRAAIERPITRASGLAAGPLGGAGLIRVAWFLCVLDHPRAPDAWSLCCPARENPGLTANYSRFHRLNSGSWPMMKMT